MELALEAPLPITPPLPISPTPLEPPLPPLPLPMAPLPPPRLLEPLPPYEEPPKLEGAAATDEDDEELTEGIPLPTTPRELPKPRPRPPSEGNSEGSNV